MKNVIKTIGIILAFCAYIATIYTATYYLTLGLLTGVDNVIEHFKTKKALKEVKPASDTEEAAMA